MINIQQQGIITLVRNALKGERNTLPEGFNLVAAIPIAKSHQILTMLYYGAQALGLSNDPALQTAFNKVCMFIAKDTKQAFAINKLIESFDKNDIEYMPLKGTILKGLYPRSDMRIMGDADILIRLEQYEKIEPILIGQGFEKVLESDHEISFKSRNLFLELHKRIIPSYNKDYYEYFGDGWSLAHKEKENSCRYQMTPEDTFIYLFTHLAKHYRDGGIGIRHVTDIWVYLNKNPQLDKAYIEKQLSKLCLLEFYKNLLDTITVWFEEKESTPITDFITEVIFGSGAYGTHQAHLVASTVRLMNNDDADKARSRRALQILFPKYKNMAIRYPVLKKAPILLPLFWVVRGIETLIFNPKKIKTNKKNIDALTDDKITDYQKALNFVGLDFNFKE